MIKTALHYKYLIWKNDYAKCRTAIEMIRSE